MRNNKALILTNDRTKFTLDTLVNLSDKYLITGLSSLNYIALTHFSTIILDCESIHSTLRKVSLGLHDNAETDALWQLLSTENGPKVYMLINKKLPPTRDMIDMGIEYATLDDLKQLIDLAGDGQETSSGTFATETNFNSVLTADDVRALSLSGVKNLPPNTKLTHWASEVADSLQMRRSEAAVVKMIYPVNASTKKELQKLGEKLFAFNIKNPDVLYLLTPALIPAFNTMFPSLKGKTISSTIHWAKQGAFTGEVSAEMLSDLNCYGAIIPNIQPYNENKNIAALIKQAADNFITLFSTFSIASEKLCDIIASNKNHVGVPIILQKADMTTLNSMSTNVAVIIDEEFLK